MLRMAIAGCGEQYQRRPKVEVLDGFLRLLAAVQWSATHNLSSSTVTMLHACTDAVQQGRLPATSFAAADVASRIALPILRASGA
jgi:hypothetical protein